LQLLATPQGACSAQKRPAKDAPKIAVHLSNPRGRTWTARDQFSAPFAVVKQYHIAGNTLVNSCLKFGTMMTGIFLRKRLSFERSKSFESLRCVVNPLRRTEPPDKKGAIRTAWRMMPTYPHDRNVFSHPTNQKESNLFSPIIKRSTFTDTLHTPAVDTHTSPPPPPNQPPALTGESAAPPPWRGGGGGVGEVL